MITYPKTVARLLCGIALFATPARAELPIGQHQIPFGSPQAIWDLSGAYSETAFNTTSTFVLVQDDKGKITGTGNGTGSEAGIDFVLNFTILGSIKTMAEVTRTQLNMKFTGTATDGATSLPIRGNFLLKLDLDETTRALIGAGTLTVCARGRCAKERGPVSIDLPQSEDGRWTLILDLQSVDDKKVVGTGEALLDNGRILPLNISGQYKSTTDVTALKTMKGSAGQVALQLTAEAGQIVIQKFSATLLGQKVKQ